MEERERLIQLRGAVLYRRLPVGQREDGVWVKAEPQRAGQHRETALQSLNESSQNRCD